ncbi:MAG: hypothetical protein RR330_05225 [Alistipes sp.]
MENQDELRTSSTDPDEDLFLHEVVKEDADLLYLDSYLHETFQKRGWTDLETA